MTHTPPTRTLARAGTEQPDWHSLSPQDVAARLDLDPSQGLSEAQAMLQLAQHGQNRLAEQAPRSQWLAFADQFKSLLILVLIGAALLAGIVGDPKDALVILLVVLFNAVLGFWQEYRAEATLAALKQMLAPSARVKRAGQVQHIPAVHLVPGDLVLLEAGDRVPADGRLLAAHSVEIDEAALTGESHPVGKDARACAQAGAPLAERLGMVFMNSVVTRGRAEMIVTATGMATEMGRISGLLASTETAPTPLQQQINALGKRLALIAVVVISLIFLLGLLRGVPLLEIMLTSITLAVASIPEGLPAVLTVTLALGMHRMARQRAIVKKLAAVETLGCTTVICSDKTGTLTMNQMAVRAVVFQGRHFSVSGEGYGGSGQISADDGGALPDLMPLLHPAALANDSRIRDGALIGDPTEGALLALAARGGIDVDALALHQPRIAEIPFDSTYKFQASFHHDGDRVRLHVKGAPDALLARASQHGTQTNAAAPLDDAARADWIGENERLAGAAMRVLALAGKTIAAQDFDPAGDLMVHVSDLSFIGLAGIIDPPRPEAREAIALCQRAGIQVKMITGDHRVTARAIARELGLHGEVLEGRELDAMGAQQLSAVIDQVDVFARVSPEHKVRIVQALKAHGHITAMTGDGVNDAPALKSADIGVAMGITGTTVAKEAATMVLTDDNFASIVHAVKEGRTIFDNIVKFLRSQLSTNMAAIQTVLGASLLGWATPFTPIMILWFNMVMDGPPAMSLGVEPTRHGVMQEPPRPTDARILTGARFALLLSWGFIIAVGTLSLHHYAQPMGHSYALTLTFTTFVLFQFFSILAARFERGSAVFNRNFFRNRWLWLALLIVLTLQATAVHWTPAQAVFDTTDLRLQDWLLATAVASSVLLLDELRKLVQWLWMENRRISQP